MDDKNCSKRKVIDEHNGPRSQPREKVSFFDRLKKDVVFRHKVSLSVALFSLFACLGWNVSQLGPALLDLQIITKTRLDEASYFLTAFSLGFLVAVAVAGWIFKKINRIIVLFVSTILIAIVTVVTPWCRHFGLMIVVFVVRGLTHGVADAGGNINILKIWGTESGPYMQTMHFSFAIGAVISPLAMAPFLNAQIPQDDSKTTQKECLRNLTMNSTNNFNSSADIFMNVDCYHKDTIYKDSIIHGAFVISAGITLLSGLSFSYFLFHKADSNVEQTQTSRLSSNLPKSIRLTTIGIICITFFCVQVLEKSIVFYLTAFTVEHFAWPKALGSYATSAFWASHAFGRFTAIGITKRFRIRYIFGLYILMNCVCSVCLLITNLLKLEIGIWIFIPISGLCQSILFPSLMCWTEQDFFKVSGKIVSLFMLTGSGGSMLTPIFLGYLIDLYSPMWFSYGVLIFSICLIIIYIVLFILARRIESHGKENELFINVS
ncbi:sodium-dependent glucose transporter 1A-like [Mytilus trossulus]|uniref:sodium-dependent glucose transporter 1A-like n=1 Tax=Mytilus trossulus TaxID=6551 RepID=UPI003006150A